MIKTKYENLRRILNFTTYKTFEIKTSLRISKTQEALKFLLRNFYIKIQKSHRGPQVERP